MARYVDAEKLVFEPDEQGGANGVLILDRRNGKTMRLVLTALKKMVDGLPTEDVALVVHGRWEPHMEEMEDGFGKFEPVQTGLRCSVCGRYSCCGGNFCKDCGAKMDEKP